jgi:hypothetical protein
VAPFPGAALAGREPLGVPAVLVRPRRELSQGVLVMFGQEMSVFNLGGAYHVRVMLPIALMWRIEQRPDAEETA